MLNPFEAFAAAHTPRAVKQRRESKGQKKRDEEKGKLTKIYLAGEKRRTEALLATPRGKRLARLLKDFDELSIDGADIMIEKIEAAKWLRRADINFRHEALRLIHNRICRIRKDAGLTELDDPLWDEPDSAFIIIRRLLGFCQ